VETELERLRQKVENFPSPSTYTRLAELLRASGDARAATDACQRCIREFPRTGQAYVILAELAFAAGNKDEAVKNLTTAAERDPRSYAAHRQLSDHYAAAGKPTQALVHLRQILTFKPNDADVLKRIAELTPKGTPAPAPKPITASIPRPAMAVVVPKGLGPLVNEAGVRGALIVDGQGRVVSSSGLTTEQEELSAALCAEFSRDAVTALGTAGYGELSQWMLAATQGQVMVFTRDGTRSVVVLAESGVRPAMLEIRARQALAELGAS